MLRLCDDLGRIFRGHSLHSITQTVLLSWVVSHYDRAMSIRRFFLLSLRLAVLAVGLDMTALSLYSRGARVIAEAVVLRESERAVARSEAQTYRSRGTVISLAGLAFALASLILVIVSARKHEPAWRSVTFALLVFYVMLQFALT